MNFSPTNTFIISILLSAVCGFSIRMVLTLTKQMWANTLQHTISFVMLPVITLSITHIISGNIALALGMVGALSIVRFRNPVKNPFELVVFFLLITVGIIISVKIKYGILLTVFFILVVTIVNLIETFFKKKGLKIFSISFNEGNINNYIEISSEKEIEELENSKILIQVVRENNLIMYRLASNNKKDIQELYTKLKNNALIKNLNVEFN
jgi:hypothetical protein